MHERSLKRPRDVNQLAASIVSDAVHESAVEQETESKHAEAGRLGGLKGGKARAEKLSPQERTEIARKAARARWQSE